MKWRIETIPTGHLQEWQGNPRKISPEDFELLKQSFIDYGAARTLTCNPIGKGKYEIIGGNQSLKALRELGYKEIQCSIPERALDETEKRKLAIYLNHRNKGEGEWDYDVLDTWDDVDFEEIGLVREQSRLSKIYGNDVPFEETQIEYPILIITNRIEFEEWKELKEKLKIKDDTKLFFKIAKLAFLEPKPNL